MLVRFRDSQSAAEDADCRVLLGSQGRLTVKDLRLEKGVAHWQCALGSVEMPIAALEAFTLPRSPSPARTEMLVFNDGDELGGALLEAEPGRLLRWRTHDGQEINFPSEHVAGVRFAPDDKADSASSPVLLELRNGEQLSAELTSFDGKKLGIRHPLLGIVTLDRERLWKIFPNRRTVKYCGTRDEETLVALDDSDQRPDQVHPEEASFEYIRLGGALLSRSGSWSLALRKLADEPADLVPDPYEISFDITNPWGRSPDALLQLKKRGGGRLVSIGCFRGKIELYSDEPYHRSHNNIEHLTPTSRVNVRAFVNPKLGTVEIFLDGFSAGTIGGKAAERVLGIGAVANLFGYDFAIVSNLWIGPWMGELPKDHAGTEITLSNADVISGTITGLRDRKLLVESDAGALELSLDDIPLIDFGGAAAPQRAVARLRLPDGSAINLDRYHFENHELIAHSETLGDLRVPAKAVWELLFEPPLARPPHPLVTGKVAAEEQKPSANDAPAQVDK